MEEKCFTEKQQIQCNWSEMLNGVLTQCFNMEAIKDEFNVNERYFCNEHMLKVQKDRFRLYLKMKKEFEGV